MITATAKHTAFAFCAFTLAALGGCRSDGVFSLSNEQVRVEARIVDVDAMASSVYRVEVQLSNEGTRDATVDLCYAVERRVGGMWVAESRVAPFCPLSPASLIARGSQVTSEALMNMVEFTPAELEDTTFRLVYMVMLPGDVDYVVQETATGSFSLRFLD